MARRFTCRIPGRTGCYQAELHGGTLTELRPIEDGAPEAQALWLTRGLFDMQVNGMLGHDLSGEELTADKVVQIEKELGKHGVLRWCPTITTQDPAIVRNNLAILGGLIESGQVRHVHCIHMEGHYICAEEGYRGVHLSRFIRDPDPPEFDEWQRLSGHNIGLFSLAPERKGAIEFIGKLKKEGVKVGLVHHHAEHETIQRAAAAGADLSSHLVNGCARMIHRQHNIIWSQLSLAELWASFIADGYHIPSYTLKAVISAKGIERSILISDLAHLSGLPDGEYSKQDLTVVLQDGGLWVKGQGTNLLSGAVKTLEQDCTYLAARCGFTIEQALVMASLNPGRYFGIEGQYDIFPGAEGPFAVFAWDGKQLTVERIVE